jgi:hypothetical protein
VNYSSVVKIARLVHTNNLSACKTVAAQSWCSKLSRKRFSALAHGFFSSGIILPPKSGQSG